MDNIKTKLQTQTTPNTCEKLEFMLKDEKKSNPINNLNASSTNAFSTINKMDCNSNETIKYKNIYSTIKYIWMEEGFFKGFFKGVTPRVINNAPSCAISWCTYEFVKNFLTFKSN